MAIAGGELWVFGYGSLMWRPDIVYEERVPATLVGYHRDFCILSTHYRGRPERPGLVLGLDRGGACTGVAYRVADRHRRSTVAYLRARELIYGVYRETRIPVLLHGQRSGGAEVQALTYVAERAHPSYAGRLSLAATARAIRAASGRSGSNLDYLINTIVHLRDMEIREPRMERLLALAAGYASAAPVRSDGSRAAAVALRRVWARHQGCLPGIGNADQRRFMYRMRVGTRAGDDA